MMSIDCLTDLGMDDEGDDDPVPLPNVNAAILKKVQETHTHGPIHTSHHSYQMHILLVIAVQQVCWLKLKGLVLL